MSRTQRRRPASDRLAGMPRPKPRKPRAVPEPAKPAFPKISRQALIVRLLISAVGIGYIAKVIHDGLAAQHR